MKVGDPIAYVAETKFVVPEAMGRCRTEPVPAAEVAGWLKAGGIQ